MGRKRKPHWTWRFGKGMTLISVLVIGLASLAVGGHDSYVSVSLAPRLFAGVLVVAGLAGAFGAASLLLRRDSKMQPRMVWALLLAVVPGVLMFTRQCLSYEFGPRAILWLGLAVLPIVCFWIFRREGLSLTWPSTVTAAVVVSTIAASLPLLISARPVSQPQTLSTQLTLEVVGTRGSGSTAVDLVKVTRTLTNESMRTLVVIGSVYSVHATMSQPRGSLQHGPFWEELNDAGWAGRFESQKEWELVETGFDSEPAQSYYEPGQSDTTSFVVLVPAGQFNTVGVDTWTITGRKDRLTIQANDSPLDKTLSSEDGSGEIVAEWPIETDLWTDRLTQQGRYLHLAYTFGGRTDRPYSRAYEGGMQYSVYADAAKYRTKPMSPYNERLGRAYGINQVNAYTEIALDGEKIGAK